MCDEGVCQGSAQGSDVHRGLDCGWHCGVRRVTAHAFGEAVINEHDGGFGVA